ncbi:MAG: hypothetical protein AB7G93_03105 [Bdellovibrionales bacterium]
MVRANPLRVASIDIGSNAIRLFVGQRSPSGRVRVLEDQRASVRLGADAFSSGYIRPATQAELARALSEFREICDRLKVNRIRAIGTSALRDSSNSRKVIAHLKDQTGIQVQLISGRREAALLHKAISHAIDLRRCTALLMDLGGGSLETVLSRRGQVLDIKSLPLGAVRLLSKTKGRPQYEDFAAEVRSPLYRLRIQLLGVKPHPIEMLIGTGGNLRALGRLCYRQKLSRTFKRFHRDHLQELTISLFALNLNERIKRFQLKKDRADVILPAAVVTLELMRIFEIDEITVPDVGLKNGLFWETVDATLIKSGISPFGPLRRATTRKIRK